MSAFNGGPAQTQSLNVPVGATPISTWANLPDPSTITGLVYRVTDFGVAGVGLLVISDGVRWLPFGAQLLARSAVAASVTGTTNETVLATVTVPANLLGLNGGVELRTAWTVPNTANTKSLRTRLGGIAGAQFMTINVTTVATFSDIRRIRNRGATGSQVGSAPVGAAGGVGTNTVALPTGALDTTASQDLVLTGQLATASETITLENLEVWITA